MVEVPAMSERPDPFADYNKDWREPCDIPHTFRPTGKCAACIATWPYPPIGCMRAKIPGARYPGDPKVKDETPSGARPDSGDPFGAQ